MQKKFMMIPIGLKNLYFIFSCPSITIDETVAPKGKENLMFLIPLAPGLNDTNEMREKYFNVVLERLKKLTEMILKAILCTENLIV